MYLKKNENLLFNRVLTIFLSFPFHYTAVPQTNQELYQTLYKFNAEVENLINFITDF